MNWRRLPSGLGWESDDREVVLERGAPMSTGGTNAWMIWYRATPEEYEQAAENGRWGAFDAQPVRRYSEVTVSAVDPVGEWYLHGNDAGSLAEAKETAEAVLAERKRMV